VYTCKYIRIFVNKYERSLIEEMLVVLDELVEVFIVLILFLLHLHDFDLGRVADQCANLSAFFHFVENQLELVGLQRVFGQQELLG